MIIIEMEHEHFKGSIGPFLDEEIAEGVIRRMIEDGISVGTDLSWNITSLTSAREALAKIEGAMPPKKRCARLDDHEAHVWRGHDTPRGYYRCMGPPIHSMAEHYEGGHGA